MPDLFSVPVCSTLAGLPVQTDTIKKPSFLIIAAQNEDSAKVKHQIAERATRTRLLLVIGYVRVDVGLTVDVNKALS